jgi:starch synthase
MPGSTPFILFATSELQPLVKTGGLGDVAAALPPALRALGADVRLLLPAYPKVLAQVKRLIRLGPIHGAGAMPEATLLQAHSDNVGAPLYLLECPLLYERNGGPYQDVGGHDYADNHLRFGALSWAAASIGRGLSPLDWRPDIVHGNDWQTGLAPAYLRLNDAPAKSLITIHNLAFQGIFPAYNLGFLALPPSSFQVEGVEYYNQISFLKAGLVYADRITTVSPTYGREIQEEPLGFGLQGLLKQRSSVLTGILNGIDTEEWDPAHDRFIAHTYSAARLGKAVNKAQLQRDFGLPNAPRTPLFGTVSRITDQKGLDVIAQILPRLVEMQAQYILLGAGDPALEAKFTDLAATYPQWIACRIGYHEGLSHLIEAGADSFLMPSRFEPCGLNQMYSQRYGTPPIVHGTGGLADSVVDCTPETLADCTASGFVFRPLEAAALLVAIERALICYRDERTWRKLQKSGMAKDFSWRKSAAAYLEIYREMLGLHEPPSSLPGDETARDSLLGADGTA